jgi:3-oxoacyl-[acyl-carrier-protein] synthase-3
MKYSRVFIDAFGYELPPVVVTSGELEDRLDPVYEALHIPKGQLEALTGIAERRWWERGFPLSEGAVAAARKALDQASVKSKDIDILIYGGVCRENFEPATACRVAAALDINPNALIYDISNACLGVLNGIIDIANRIELGQSRAGLVVSCESAREINELTIRRMLKDRNMDNFKISLATLTGGSGAVAVLLTDGSFRSSLSRRLLGGIARAAPEFYHLCRWGITPSDAEHFVQTMVTDSISVLKFGVELGMRTWRDFLKTLELNASQVKKVICHQVGASHRDTILDMLRIPHENDFSTFPFLGNIGTVSLPITAAIAEEREFLLPGDTVGFLGIGSGLNCLMLGWEW